MSLNDIVRTQITNALRRKSITKCSEYVQKYRIMGKPIPGPMSFKYHPWSRGMHDSEAYKNIGQKSAQAGFTEVCIDRTFFKIDIERTDCLYVLPNKSPDASDFSSARFQPALELSPHLASLFSDVQNVGHKRAGSSNLYIRGSRSRSGLRSLPAGFMVLDEFDEMDQHAVSLAIERMSGQFSKQLWEVSTPTIPNWGINKEFLGSSQEHFFFPCPLCSRQTELVFPDCFILQGESLLDPAIYDSKIICKECKGTLTHETKHEWLRTGDWQSTADNHDPDVRGFYVNQLYSSTIKPVDIARSMITAQLDPVEEQELYNSKMGLPHIVEGARVTDPQIDACILKGYKSVLSAESTKLTTLGIDVGSFLHYEVDEWDVVPGPDINTNAVCRVLSVGKLRHFNELDQLMRDFQIKGCVIDVNPERRKAKEFADRFFGYIKLAYYGRGVQARAIKLGGGDNEIVADHQMTIDRTSWLDLALGRFQKQNIILPYDIPHEYRFHLKNQVKIFKKDPDGGPVARYESTGPDHFGHARVYAEAALPLAAATVTATNIENFL